MDLKWIKFPLNSNSWFLFSYMISFAKLISYPIWEHKSLLLANGASMKIKSLAVGRPIWLYFNPRLRLFICYCSRLFNKSNISFFWMLILCYDWKVETCFRLVYGGYIYSSSSLNEVFLLIIICRFDKLLPFTLSSLSQFIIYSSFNCSVHPLKMRELFRVSFSLSFTERLADLFSFSSFLSKLSWKSMSVSSVSTPIYVVH